jgi:nitrogen fixation NifU-like protein
MAYSKEVIERFNNVLNNPEKFSVGRFDPSDSRVATGMVGAPSCGDVMRIQLLVEDNIIQDVKFKTYGCGSAIASSSKLVELLIGKTLQEAREVKNRDIANALQLPPIKIHCSVLAEDAIQKAIEDYEQRQQIQTS